MPNWAGSDRRSRLPKDWFKRRARVLRRDGHRCTHTNDEGARCPEDATDVDHITPGDDDREENLTSLCSWHHKVKSGQEGARAAAIVRKGHAAKFKRTERHPGLL